MNMIQNPPAPNYDESKVGDYTLPDPLIFNDGTPVRTAEDWTGQRRAELLALFQTHVFGRTPQPPRSVPAAEVFDSGTAFDGQAIRKQVTIYFSPDKRGPKMDVLIYIPTNAHPPAPLLLALNFRGNQAVVNDPRVRLATVWDPKTHEKRQVPDESRGQDTSFAVADILARGYGFATVCYQDIEPDFNGGYVHSIRPLFLTPGQTEPAPNDWGAIGAWAFGLSRVMDYLETERDVDARRVAILGHSRLGKTVLWAGAQDPRFALVLCSCSGEGGASLMRRNYGETIADLVRVFPYWFCANFGQYAGRADALPVDAHTLIALNAPRPVYVTGAHEDRWADPTGEFLACVAAGPAYRLLGAQDLGTNQMPPLDQPIQRTLAYHYRTGGHAVTAFDGEQFLAFADKHLQQRTEA